MDSLEDILPTLYDLRFQTRTSIGMVALLMYDLITTLDNEVEYFWTLSFSPIDLSFFLLRYFAIARSIMTIYHTNGFMYVSSTPSFSVGRIQSSHSIRRCSTFTWIISLLDWGIILCMDYMLYLRVRALYFLDNKLSRVISSVQFLYALNAAISLASLLVSLIKTRSVTVSFTNDMSHATCAAENAVAYLAELRCLYWSAPLVYGCVLMGLALYKAAQIRRSLGFRGLTLVKLLLIDQAIYFVFVLICSIANIVSGIIPYGPLLNVLYVVGGAQLLSLQGSRMLIRLKKAMESKIETEANIGIACDVSCVQFRNYTVDENTPSAQLP